MCAGRAHRHIFYGSENYKESVIFVIVCVYIGHLTCMYQYYYINMTISMAYASEACPQICLWHKCLNKKNPLSSCKASVLFTSFPPFNLDKIHNHPPTFSNVKLLFSQPILLSFCDEIYKFLWRFYIFPTSTYMFKEWKFIAIAKLAYLYHRFPTLQSWQNSQPFPYLSQTEITFF